MDPRTNPSFSYNPTFDNYTMHADDLSDDGFVFDGVRRVIPDYESANRRHLADIKQSIALREAREKKVAEGLQAIGHAA